MYKLLNIKIKWLSLPFIIISLIIISVAVSSAQNAENLLNRAKSIYNKQPDLSIKLTNQAYQLSKISNNYVAEVESLNLLAQFFFRKRDYDHARLKVQNALKVADKYRLDSLKGDSWLILAAIEHSAGNYQKAINKYAKSIFFYKKGSRVLSIAKSYLNIGICQMQLSSYNESIENCLLAERYFENANDNRDIANTYKTIASCFFSLTNYPKAIIYNKKALVIRQKLNDSVFLAQSFNNLGNVFKEDNQPDSAIFYLKKSLSLYQKQPDDSSLMVLPQQNLGSAYKMKRKFILAERYIKRSLNIAAKYNMQEERAEGELDLCEILIEEMKYSAALVAANITEKIAAQLKLKDLLMQTYADKSSIYTKEYNYKEALRYETEKDKLKDSIFSVAKDKAINELEIKYQTDLKNKDIVSLNLKNKLQSKTVAQQKLSIVALVTGAVLLLLLFGIAYRAYRQKASDNQKIQHLMQELHHRVKNNLQIMSGLFEMQINSLNDEATKSALRENETRLASMNLIHSVLYQRQSDTKIEMEAYLTKLLHHIQSSFGGGREQGIQLRFDVEPLMVEADKAVSIGLIVNELATNAFKYAFDGKKGEIYLGLKQESKGRLLLSLGDNGKGMNTARKKNSVSFGLKLVNLLAKQLGAVMHVQNENGTLYRFEIYI